MPRSARGPSVPGAPAHGRKSVGRGRPRDKEKLENAKNSYIMPGMKAGELVTVRERLGWTIAQVADFAGVTVQTVYRWENGTHRVTGKRARLALQDLRDRASERSWTREDARVRIVQDLGVDAAAAGRLLVRYGRAPGESWRDVAGRVTDGERYEGRARPRRSTG